MTFGTHIVHMFPWSSTLFCIWHKLVRNASSPVSVVRVPGALLKYKAMLLIHNTFFHVENCALLGYYAMSSGNFFLMFWDNLLDSWTLRMGLIRCPKTWVRNYNSHCIIIQKGAVLCCFTVEAWNHAIFHIVLVNSHLGGHSCMEDVDCVITH